MVLHYGNLRCELDPAQTVYFDRCKTLYADAKGKPELLRASERYFLHRRGIQRIGGGNLSTSTWTSRSTNPADWPPDMPPRFQIRKKNASIRHPDVRFFMGCPSPTVVVSLAPFSFMHQRSDALAVPMNTSSVHGRSVEPVSRRERA